MSYKDIDHIVLKKAFHAKSLNELGVLAASCGYDLSDDCLCSVSDPSICPKKICMEYTQF